MQQWYDLMKLCEFSLNEKRELLYRGSEHGFGANDFHAKCDGKPNTLTILRADGTSNIFGGFTSVAWSSHSVGGEYKRDRNAFLFSLVNQENHSIKIKVSPSMLLFVILLTGPLSVVGVIFL